MIQLFPKKQKTGREEVERKVEKGWKIERQLFS